MRCRIFHHTLSLLRRQHLALSAIALFCAVQLPGQAMAHTKGLYKTQAEAEERAKKAAQAMGLEPVTMVSAGGLDANWLVKHGVPTVTFGAGQAEIHTVNEYVVIPEFAQGCRLAVAIATLE